MQQGDYTELGEEYANIILRQETGMDTFGDEVARFQDNDTERLSAIEDLFFPTDMSLSDFVDTAFELQREAVNENLG